MENVYSTFSKELYNDVMKFSEPEMEISLNKMGGFEHMIPKVFKYEDLSDNIKQQINFTYTE